ncbi:MAG: hypothetical protein MUP81_02110, partial [Dehalococcoidia bacterium]|nr:hypothetical protein [Dehalococcoidia bacterium]
AWRKEAPSDKQLKILKEKGYAVEGLTRGMASDILENFFKRRKRGGGLVREGSGNGNAASGNSGH